MDKSCNWAHENGLNLTSPNAQSGPKMPKSGLHWHFTSRRMDPKMKKALSIERSCVQYLLVKWHLSHLFKSKVLSNVRLSKGSFDLSLSDCQSDHFCQTESGSRQARKLRPNSTEQCECQCLKSHPTFREDQQNCVNDFLPEGKTISPPFSQDLKEIKSRKCLF